MGVSTYTPLTADSSGISVTDRSLGEASAEFSKESTGPPTEDKEALKHVICQGVNVLLIFVPLGIMSKGWGFSSACVFGCNFMAIIPLAGILGSATESLSEHVGEIIGGLVNATFGNAVEMIITIDAIKHGLCKIVQGGLIGSLLSNLLLVLGMAFVASGVMRKEQKFNVESATANSALLLLSAIGVTLPTLFAHMDDTDEDDTLRVSRMCSIILAVVYAFFMLFQLKTHRHHFLAAEVEENGNREAGEDPEHPEPVLSGPVSVIILLAITLLISHLSEYLVGSIEDVSEEYGLPKAFIGLILLPIVGNAAEHMTAVTSAFKGKMDLALAVAVGSSTQVALFIVPFAIIVGWVYDQPVSLNFGVFHCGTLAFTVFLVGHVLNDGTSNWLEGLMLLATYFMIAAISWNISESN
mmetsp:Transcript_4215/g.7860  ORF Transcript_4215/g.7860 Transcript_4215/m.7860 type:complete len:412 (+) Transcript_4215:122-1357(+)